MNTLLLKRIMWGKGMGACIGVVAFMSIPWIFPDASFFLRIGILLWYIVFGLFIALAGIITNHPFVSFRIPTYIRGAFLGGFLNLTLVMISYDSLTLLFTTSSIFLEASPFWFVLEGVIIGLILDIVLTIKTAEGADLCSQYDS